MTADIAGQYVIEKTGTTIAYTVSDEGTGEEGGPRIRFQIVDSEDPVTVDDVPDYEEMGDARNYLAEPLREEVEKTEVMEPTGPFGMPQSEVEYDETGWTVTLPPTVDSPEAVKDWARTYLSSVDDALSAEYEQREPEG